MRYGSLCSGIEAASVAWESLEWKPTWFAEIEKFPSAVLAHHWPDIANLGDMTKIVEMLEGGEIEAPDVLVGGTPCQAFSVAGLRQSLDDDRGGLSLEYIRIVNTIDKVRKQNGKEPCICLWENVPGVLNTKDNAFGCFLGGLAGEDSPIEPPGKRWTNAGYVLGPQRTVSWRILDAQYFGVAQRRRRVFVVASAREGFDSRKILFESEGLRRDIAPSRETREDTSTDASKGTRSTDPIVLDRESFNCGKGFARNLSIKHDEITPTLVARGPHGVMMNQITTNELCPTLQARDYKDINSDDSAMGGKHVLMYENHPNDSRVTGPLEISPAVVARYGTGGGNVPLVQHDKIPRQKFSDQLKDRHAVAFEPSILKREGNPNRVSEEVTPTLRSNMGDNQTAVCSTPIMQVRRLTPKECERLQGFPDSFTDIPYGRPRYKALGDSMAPMGPRYKALGNSMAVPVMTWIGRRIENYVNGEPVKRKTFSL